MRWPLFLLLGLVACGPLNQVIDLDPMNCVITPAGNLGFACDTSTTGYCSVQALYSQNLFQGEKHCRLQFCDPDLLSADEMLCICWGEQCEADHGVG